MTSMLRNSDRFKIFTWHIHGSYLYYLSQCNVDIYIPVNEERNEGYYGRGKTFLFNDNVTEVPVGEVKQHSFDCILFQSEKNLRIAFTSRYRFLFNPIRHTSFSTEWDEVFQFAINKKNVSV